MKKIFKTVALATAIAVGAATMTGCPNPVMPEDNTEQDNNDPGNGGSTENPSDPQTQTIILSTNPHDTRPGYLAPRNVIPNGIILDRFGQAQHFNQKAIFEESKFEDGKTYRVESTPGALAVEIIGNGGLGKTFNIVSHNVPILLGAANYNINITSDVNDFNQLPIAPLTNTPAIMSGKNNTQNITGTKYLLIQDPSGFRRLP